MRLTLGLLLVLIVQGWAIDSYSQKVVINLDLKNVDLIKVLDEIENQTEYYFLFNYEQIHSDKKINVKLSNSKIDEALNRILEGTGLNYTIKNRQIIISKDDSDRVTDPGLSSSQQQKTISGRITDSSGAPIPGVSVVIKGTTVGTITNNDGKYSISGANSGSILVFSFIGMSTQEVKVETRKEINITLSPDVIGIDEVVVTALGIERDKKTLGYAISTIKADKLTASGNAQNPVLSLYGKAAGVTIRQSASGTLGGININIRGAAGLESDASTRPLFVIDGVPIFDENTGLDKSSFDYGSGINDINPEDIESIEILKGAKASVLYGSEGANGVVLIKTKSGIGNTKNRVNVSASFSTSVEQPLTYVKLQNEYGSGENIYDVKTIIDGEKYPRYNSNSKSFGPAFDSSQQRIWWDNKARPYVAQPNNYDFLFSNGSNNQANVAIDKNGDWGNVRISYTNMNYQGIEENLWQKKNVLSFSSTYKLSKRFTVEAKTNLYWVKTQNRPQNTLGFFVDGVSRDAPFEEFINNGDYLYSDASSANYGYKKDFEEAGYPTGYYSLKDYASYVWGRKMNTYLDDKFHFIGSVRPVYWITDWLSVSGQIGLDYTDTDFTNKVSVTKVDPDLVGGSFGYSRKKSKIQEYKGMVNAFRSFMDSKLDVAALAGISYKNNYDETISVSTISNGTSSGFIYPGWYSLENQNPNGWASSTQMDNVRSYNYGEDCLYGVFGVLTLTWDKKYTLELNARNDWSSTLDPDHNSYFYPGVAFTWDATSIMKRYISSLQFGKFRVSAADVGRAAPSRYYAYNSLSAGTISGTKAQSVSSSSSLFAGSIKPERKRELELGTELAFFKGNRLKLDASFYTNAVYDQIMSVPLSKSTGAEEIKINAGQVNNWGYEIQIDATPVLTKQLRWDLSFTTANQFSKVKKLYSGITKKTISGMRGGVNVEARVGERIGNIYGTALSVDPDGNRIVSSSGSSYVLDGTSETRVGNVFPDFMGGFNTTVSYKNFTLYAGFDYSFGASMYSETNQWLYYNGASVQSLAHRDAKHGGIEYTSDGKTYYDGLILDGVQKITDSNGGVTYQKNTTVAPVSSYYSTFVSWSGEAINAVDLKYKNNYIKIRELSLTYQLPKRVVHKMTLSSATIGLFARNIGYLYKSIPNLDSEAYMGTNSYFEASPIPTTRTLGINLSVGF